MSYRKYALPNGFRFCTLLFFIIVFCSAAAQMPQAGEPEIPPLPNDPDALVIRTSYSSNRRWKKVVSLVRSRSGDHGFYASVATIDDPAYSGATPAAILADTNYYANSFVFLVDEVTLSDREHPLLCVDLAEVPGRTFRVIPSEVWNVETNVSIGNMSFDEFYLACGADGIFRGF